MKKTNTLQTMFLLIMCMLLISCEHSEKSPETTMAPAKNKFTIDDERMSSPNNNLMAAREQAEKDSMIQTINMATLRLQDVKLDISDTDNAGILPLYHVYFCFRNATITNTDLWLSEVQDKMKAYIGFKSNDISSWSGSMKKMIGRFKKDLSAKQKEAIAKSLIAHASLIDSLSLLSDKDQIKLMGLLDTIAKNQDMDFDWLYTSKCGEVLIQEYAILKKVWNMPALIKCDMVFAHGTQDTGYYYTLGKYIKECPVTERMAKTGEIHLTWNTRYYNRYQFAVGIFHRRCLATNTKTPSERRVLAHKISATMREGAKLLQPIAKHE